MEHTENVCDRLALETFFLEHTSVVSTAAGRQLVDADVPQGWDQALHHHRLVVLPGGGVEFRVFDDGAIGTERGPAAVPGTEVGLEGAASGDIRGRIEDVELGAVREMSSIVERAKADLTLDDLEDGRAPTSVLRGIGELGELAAADSPPPEVQEELALVSPDAHVSPYERAAARPLRSVHVAPAAPIPAWPSRNT